MRFHLEHRFASPVAAVLTQMVDPSLYTELDLADVETPELLGRDVDGDRITLHLRYVYSGHIDPMVQRLIGTGQLRWLQDIEVDAQDQTGNLSFVSEDRNRRLQGAARIGFRIAGDMTERFIDGDVTVKVPIVGSSAERRIIAGLAGRLESEANAIRSRLGENET